MTQQLWSFNVALVCYVHIFPLCLMISESSNSPNLPCIPDIQYSQLIALLVKLSTENFIWINTIFFFSSFLFLFSFFLLLKKLAKYVLILIQILIYFMQFIMIMVSPPPTYSRFSSPPHPSKSTSFLSLSLEHRQVSEK